MEEYHAKADRAMEVLFDTLESLVEKSGRSDWEVDYHVRLFLTFSTGPSTFISIRAACSPSYSVRAVHTSSINNLRTSRYGCRLPKGTRFHMSNDCKFTYYESTAVRNGMISWKTRKSGYTRGTANQ